MKKYLVTDNPNSGIAHLLNVGIVEAVSEKEAEEKFLKSENIDPCHIVGIIAYDVSKLKDGWKYYKVSA